MERRLRSWCRKGGSALSVSGIWVVRWRSPFPRSSQLAALFLCQVAPLCLTTRPMTATAPMPIVPDKHGHFGQYGGMFVPETLMAALTELTAEYEKARNDPAFQAELDHLLHDYVGRPTPLYFAERWTQKLGGAKIYLKREDLLHTGAHKINNALGWRTQRSSR